MRLTGIAVTISFGAPNQPSALLAQGDVFMPYETTRAIRHARPSVTYNSYLPTYPLSHPDLSTCTWHLRSPHSRPCFEGSRATPPVWTNWVCARSRAVISQIHSVRQSNLTESSFAQPRFVPPITGTGVGKLGLRALAEWLCNSRIHSVQHRI
jgi:hypothetical protein